MTMKYPGVDLGIPQCYWENEESTVESVQWIWTVLRINLFYGRGSITVAFIAPWWLGFMNENEIKSLF